VQELSKQNDDLQNQVNELKTLVQTLVRKEGNNAGNLSSAYMKQNAPNPFNNTTVISYYTPANAQIKNYRYERRCTKNLFN
jgi:hypothetical protein